MDGYSLDVKNEKINALKSIFPEIVSEDKIDWERLRATLGEDVSISNERYVLNWAGKSDAFRTLQTGTSATLAPAKEESVNFDTTDNIFIEGENLEVLKILQKAYFGKIKCIIIDPPYNTGNDSFIYPDRFSESKDEYMKRVGDKDEDGFLMKEGLFRKNSKENGQYHSNWLSMMYPRLFLARNLLRDDGVIFVHIDDNEVHNLRLLMNEIFGEENFFAMIIVRANSRGQTYKQIAKTHEYILVFTKMFETELNELEKDGDSDDLNQIDDIGKFNIRELRNRNPKFGKHNRPNLFYPIYVNPNQSDKDGFSPISLVEDEIYCIKVLPLNSEKKESCWRWGVKKLSSTISNNTLQCNIVAQKKSNGNYGIYEKYRKTTYKPKSIWNDNSFLTESGTVELKQLKFGNEFDFPKPVNLMKQCIALATDEEDIILDFFSGSGTTAHAVLDLNKEDGSNRKFILVQLPEKTDESTEAHKAGYMTIADICKERIRRVIKKIEEERKPKDQQQLIEEEQAELDLGFKVFKLKPSNFKQWRTDIQSVDELEEQLDAFTDPVKPEAEEENMLYELLLKSGYDLTSKIVVRDLGLGTCYYDINDGELVLQLSGKPGKTVESIIESNPKKVLMLDRLFENNDQLKTNTYLQFKDAGVDFRTV